MIVYICDYLQGSISVKLIEDVSILLGIGVFLLWCGLFGFLKYFESLNVSAIYTLHIYSTYVIAKLTFPNLTAHESYRRIVFFVQ